MTGSYPDKIKQLPLYDGRFDAHKLRSEGCDVLFASYPAGTYIDFHDHDTDNHGVITRGELQLTIDGKVSSYKSGDWYHIPAKVKHAAKFRVDTEEIEFWFNVR